MNVSSKNQMITINFYKNLGRVVNQSSCYFILISVMMSFQESFSKVANDFAGEQFIISYNKNDSENFDLGVDTVDKLTGYLDLGRGFKEDSTRRTGKSPFSVIKMNGEKSDHTTGNDDAMFYAPNSIDLITFDQGGTRLDSPHHFNENAWKVADIPLENLFVPGKLCQHFLRILILNIE